MIKNRGNEKKVEDDIKKVLKSRDIYFFKNHGNIWTEPGRPDIVACYLGYFIGIEVKSTNGGVQSEAQKFHEVKINNSNGVYVLANNKEIVIKMLDKLKEN